jgi:hypothetical protein
MWEQFGNRGDQFEYFPHFIRYKMLQNYLHHMFLLYKILSIYYII